VPLRAVLLAAGAGSRFGGAKLLAPLPDGTPVGVAALRNLLTLAVPVTAVVRPEDRRLAAVLIAEGAVVVECPDAALGMAHSLACAIRSIGSADGVTGWLIALGDMPRVKPATIAAIAAGLRGPTDIVVPFHRGKRGNPVAIGAAYRQDLLDLSGDIGARALFERHGRNVSKLEVDDPGVLTDVDTPRDLASLSG
jgi:molybdenum cofactor cytidylyltransferase